MARVGQLALVLALAAAVYSIAASVVGARLKNLRLIESGRNAAVGVFALITAAIASLASLVVTDDFSVGYVANHSSRDLPLHFKISSIWGGQEGSLLFWGWLLAIYTAFAVIQNRRKHMAMMPYVTSVLMGASAFFTAMTLFVVNPFKVAALQGPGGLGLSPLLQDWRMALHPPMLYLGLSGLAVPFAFAVAALVTRAPGDAWIHTTRRWTMVAWLFLGSGILLGSNWAYHKLGWGGLWAWDPIENAALMPWLIAAAYLQSVMVQEEKNMLKAWNVVLVIVAYILSIFGVFLTRSGIASSVHALAQSSIGGYFLAFIVVALSSALYLVFDRREYLKGENRIESFASREVSFMFNSVILLGTCFAVLWGTMLPALSEWLTGEKITVHEPWFNRVIPPMAIALLFLTGAGLLLDWRKTSSGRLKRNFVPPATIAIAAGAVLYFRGIRHFYALSSLGTAIFVGLIIVREFYRGAKARATDTGERFEQGVSRLTLHNSRRYGGYIAHFGFVLLFIGWAGQAITTEGQFEAGAGETFQLRQYVMEVDDLSASTERNYTAQRASLSVFEYGTKATSLHPERRLYTGASGQQPTTEVALWERPKEDLYLVFAGSSPDGKRAVFHAFINPLVVWVWIGGCVLIVGTLVALLPNLTPLTSRRRWPQFE